MKKIDGRKAVITSPGRRYTTYKTFADHYGYPDAAVDTDSRDKRVAPKAGDIVTLLVTGKHLTYNERLWIVETARGERFIFNENGLDIPEAPPVESDIQRTLDGLTDAVANLARRLTEAERSLAKHAHILYERAELGEVPTLPDVIERVGELRSEKRIASGTVRPAAPTRDDVIAQAKWDVSELLTQNHPFVGDEGAWFTDADGSTVTDRCEFVINREERTVVALLRYAGYSGDNKVWRRGIAKCTSDDVFNTHIGRAISLRRALGLTVPDEYLNVPQPEEVRVGDIVNGSSPHPSHYYNETKRFTLTSIRGTGSSFKYAENPTDWITQKDIGRIIDDSREGVGA